MTMHSDGSISRNTVFLGLCVCSPREGRTGHVLPLARLHREKGRNQIDRAFNLSLFGETGMVFWPQEPAVEKMDGRCVRFHVVPSPEEYLRKHGCDEYKVAIKKNVQREWDLSPFGLPVLPEEALDEKCRPVELERWMRKVAGSDFYVRRGDRIVGPWHVTGSTVEPRGVLRSVAQRDLHQGLLQWDHLSWQGEILVEHPPKDLGTIVDLSTPEQLVEWFREQLEACSLGVTQNLETHCAGWKDVLQRRLSCDPAPELVETRWRRVEEILDGIQADADCLVRLLNTHPLLRAQLDQVLAAAVDEHVLLKASEISEQALKLTEDARQRVRQEEERIRDLEREAEETWNLRLLEESRIQTKIEEAELAQMRLQETAESLNASRGRIVSDFLGIQSLLATLAPLPNSPAMVASPAPTPAPAEPVEAIATPPPTEAVSAPSPRRTPIEVVTGAPLDAPSQFIDRRLWPSLQIWHPKAGRRWALMLHSAVLHCRWTLVPDPSWARAYVDALGGTGRLSLVSVDPTWLSFRHALDAGAEACIREAHDDPDHLHFLFFDEINRALVQCWSRPLLHAVAGVADTLPVHGGVRWPSNLRVLGSIADDAAVLPVPPTFVGHCSALSRSLSPPPTTPLAPTLLDGHVHADTWRQWSQPPTSCLLETTGAAVQGPARIAARADMQRMLDGLVSMGEEEESAQLLVKRLRLEWPGEYATEEDGSC